MYAPSYASVSESTPSPSPSYLQALVRTIADGVKNIESGCGKRGVSYPTPDVLFNSETDAIQASFAKEAEPILAAAYQLIATFSYSPAYLFGMAIWGYFPAALTIAEKGLVPDILREAMPQGVHVNDIASINGLEPTKLARTLRFLCTRHIFEEVAPNVFRNTRLSSALCTGKPVREMLARPENRWDGTNGIAAVTAFSGDEGLKTAAYLLDHMFDPIASRSQEPNGGPLQRAFNTDLAMYDWQNKPGNELVSRKFQIGMHATGNHSFDAVVAQGFSWSTLPPGSVVVDVGGGVGNVTMALAGTHRYLRYVVQDRPEVIQQAHGLWAQKMPSTLESGLVQLQVHDIFEEQPIKNAAVFLMRYITHNWSDKYCKVLLGQLRKVATPSTRIVVIDHIQDHLCRTNELAKDVPGAAKPAAPEPLLPYPDSVTGVGYLLDMQMMGMLNCQERTVTEFAELFESTGWKLERIHRFESPLPHELVFALIVPDVPRYPAKL